MYRVLNGMDNIDNFHATFDGEPFEGMTVKLFDPKTKLRSIYWSDSNEGKLNPPVLRALENNVGHFITKDSFKGKPILVNFRRDARDKDNPIWGRAFSDDDGKSWEWNWSMYISKMK
jgi:hypothetical protein